MNARISPSLSETRQQMEQILGKGLDLVYRDFVLGRGARRGFLVYNGALAAEEKVQAALEAVTRYSYPPFQPPEPDGDPLQHIQDTMLQLPEVRKAGEMKSAVEAVLAGECALFLEGIADGLLLDTRTTVGRSVAEPEAESEVRGPRDGMVETLMTNIGLVRRRIRDSRLRFELHTVGQRSRTEVAIAYIQGLAPDQVVEEVRKRLKRIKVDAAAGSGQIEELIRDSPFSPFPLVLATERPDRLAANLLDGRVALMVDTTPFALVVPVTLWQLFQAPGDYYQSFWAGSAFRLIRLLAFFLSLTLPALFVMLTTFHHEMIPTPLALAIASGREGVPLPTMLEVLLMIIMFEVLHEAGLRLPRPVGQTVSIVGALVIGDAAVTAGLITPGTVITIATTGITSFALPVYSLSTTVRLVRIPLLILSGVLGAFGFLAGTAVIALHLTTLRSFGQPYLDPLAPSAPGDWGDTLIRLPWWHLTKRPKVGMGKRTRRMAKGQEPEPSNGRDEES